MNTTLIVYYLNNFACDDFSYFRAKKRYNTLLPALKSSSIDMIVAIDTSVSISQEEVDVYITEINTIKSNLWRNLTLLVCDDKSTHSPMYFLPRDEFVFPETLGGGGGTNFTPVFGYVNTLDTLLSCVVYFTDANAIFPKKEPKYRFLWLAKGSYANFPRGKRCKL